MGLLASNPETFAQFMQMQGMAPPAGNDPMSAFGFGLPTSQLGAAINAQPMAPQGGMNPAAMMGMPGVDPTGGAAMPGAAPAAPAMDMNQMASFLQGVKGPQATPQIMNAGVSGSQKAPDAKMGASAQMPGAVAALLQMIMGGQQQDPLRVPALGGLIRGGVA